MAILRAEALLFCWKGAREGVNWRRERPSRLEATVAGLSCRVEERER